MTVSKFLILIIVFLNTFFSVHSQENIPFKSSHIKNKSDLKFAKNEGYLGLDFEFNTKVVALMQINFEQMNKNLFESSLIFVFDPKQLDKNWNMFFFFYK